MIKVQIFISYARKDRASFKDLSDTLQYVVWDGVEVFSDQGIKSGDDWERKIKEKIAQSNVIVLLLSKSFINSKFIRNVEFPLILDKCKDGKTRLIPLILENIPIPKVLKKFQYIQGIDDAPILDCKDLKGVWRKVAEEIGEHVDLIKDKVVIDETKAQPSMLLEGIKEHLPGTVKESSCVWLYSRSGMGWNRDAYLYKLLENLPFKARFLFLDPEGESFRLDTQYNWKGTKINGFAVTAEERESKAKELYTSLVKKGHLVKVSDILLPGAFWAIGEMGYDTPTTAYIEIPVNRKLYHGNLYFKADSGNANVRAYGAIFEELWKQAKPWLRN